jgi:hypothetical protein
MKKASMAAVLITTFFFLCCGCFGYAAFGNATPGNLLTGFGFYEPYWLVDLANACICLHLVGGYQVLLTQLYNYKIVRKNFILLHRCITGFAISPSNYHRPWLVWFQIVPFDNPNGLV